MSKHSLSIFYRYKGERPCGLGGWQPLPNAVLQLAGAVRVGGSKEMRPEAEDI